MGRARCMRRIGGRTAMGAAALAAVVALAGCAHAPPAAGEPTAALVWPDAPQPPRIRYVREIRGPADLLPPPPWWRRMLAAVKGGGNGALGTPHGLARDADGRLYVTDSAYRQVHVFDPAAGRYHRFPKRPLEGLVQPLGVAVTGDGRVLVTDPVSGSVHLFSAQGRDYLGTVPDIRFRRPTGIAVDPASGDVLVMDTLASQLVVLDGTTLTEKARVGTHSAAADGFHYPTGVTASARGDIYVADTLNFRVQALGPDHSFRKSFGEAGDAPGDFSRPKAVAVDSEAHVYVVDALFDNVQIFDPEGTPLLAFGASGSGPGALWLPNAILIDADDRIYVSDPHNHRIQVFQYIGEQTP